MLYVFQHEMIWEHHEQNIILHLNITHHISSLIYQVIQAVTFLSPIVRGHQQPFTTPKRSPAELPGHLEIISQLLPSDLLTILMEVTFHPWKGHLNPYKRVTRKKLVLKKSTQKIAPNHTKTLLVPMLVQILFLPNLHHPQIVQSKLVAFFFPTSKISRETTGTPRPLAVYINLPPRGFVSAPPVSSCHSDDPSPVLKGQSPKREETKGNEATET